MEAKKFPINYLSSTLSPVRAFLGQSQLKWPAIIVIILFLNAMMMIPLTLSFSQMEWNLEATFPSVYSMIDEEVVKELQQSRMEKGILSFQEPFSLEKPAGVVAGGIPDSEGERALENRNALLFNGNEMIIKEEGAPLSVTAYTNDVNWASLQNPEEVKRAIENQWFRFNRVYLVASYSFMISFMLLVMNLFLIFGAGFFVYMAKRSSFEENSSYKESVNLIVNAMGVPVLLAVLFGLANPDITILMTIQTLGLVLMIVAIYFQTHFSKRYLKNKQQEK